VIEVKASTQTGSSEADLGNNTASFQTVVR